MAAQAACPRGGGTAAEAGVRAGAVRNAQLQCLGNCLKTCLQEQRPALMVRILCCKASNQETGVQKFCLPGAPMLPYGCHQLAGTTMSSTALTLTSLKF
jgi:hypothetical protein